MAPLRNESARSALIERLEKLSASSRAQWGSFDAPRMVCHLKDALGMALGEISTKPGNRKVFHHFPLKHLFLHVLPMPKNIPTAPEMLTSVPSVFEADRRRVVELIRRLAAMPRTMGPEHPFFGPLTNDEWNILQWKHIDHHLRQFGC